MERPMGQPTNHRLFLLMTMSHHGGRTGTPYSVFCTPQILLTEGDGVLLAMLEEACEILPAAS